MATYSKQTNWREIQFLPDQFQLGAGQEPKEEWWPWQQHRIHLDCYRNPDAPLKVILFLFLSWVGVPMAVSLPYRFSAGPKSTSVDGVATRATLICDSVRSCRSTHDVHA
jgi:hypothetical protein